VVVLVFGVSCASSSPKTEIQSSWTDPSVDTIRFRKAIVVFMSKDPVMRETAEVQLAGQIGPSRAVPSYTIFTDAELRDVEAAKRKLRDNGFDAAIVMRLVGNESDVRFAAGQSYSGPYVSYYGYSSWGWSAVSDPGYLKEERSIGIRTNLYDLAADKLLWTGVSQSFNQADTVEMVHDVASSIREELRRKKLLP
jgi:hypothetical protein